MVHRPISYDSTFDTLNNYQQIKCSLLIGNKLWLLRERRHAVTECRQGRTECRQGRGYLVLELDFLLLPFQVVILNGQVQRSWFDKLFPPKIMKFTGIWKVPWNYNKEFVVTSKITATGKAVSIIEFFPNYNRSQQCVHGQWDILYGV